MFNIDATICRLEILLPLLSLNLCLLLINNCFCYRILSVPIIQRHDNYEGDQIESKLFGHPNIMYMASQMYGEFLYSSVDRVVACPGNYSIVLTDGQVEDNITNNIKT